MAEILYTTIEFLQNNDYGTFVKGDVLTLYIEETELVNSNLPLTSTVGVKTYKNGSIITTGPTISILRGDVRRNITSVLEHGTQLCLGTSLVKPATITYFPYLWYSTLPNHPYCNINLVCDLIMVGQPVITPCSDETADDGEITVTATSTHAVEYKLSDFVYGDGQASGTFSSLIPGDYRIYIRDEKNCGLSVLVNLPFDNTYGVRFRLEYTDLAGVDTRIDITKRSYVGAIEEVCGSGTPFEIQLRGEGSTDKFEALMSSQANVHLTSETASEFAELYTNDPNLYRVNYYKALTLKHTSKVLPFLYQEEYKAPPYYISVSASDGLPELKDFLYFQRDGLPFEGSVKLIKIIAYCLSKLQLGLNIRVACNIYSTGMATTASSDPLDQSYVDVETFYIAEEEPNLEFVLRTILEPFGARIIQWDGVWNIVRVEELVGSYDYREFDKYGDYVSNSSFNPVVDIDYPTVGPVNFEAFPSLELRPGYGKIWVNYRLGLKNNILRNGDFRLKYVFSDTQGIYVPEIDTLGWNVTTKGYPLLTQHEIIDERNISWVLTHDAEMFSNNQSGKAYIQSQTYSLKMGLANNLRIAIKYKVTRSGKNNIDYPYVKLRLLVKYGSFYLTSDGSWSSNENTIDFIVTKINEYLEGEVFADQPSSGTPVDGMDFFVRVYHATPYYADFSTLTALRATPTAIATPGFYTQVIKQTGYKTELRENYTGTGNPSGTGDELRYYELVETDAAASGYNIVRPDDYAVAAGGTPPSIGSPGNERQWVLKHTKRVKLTNEIFGIALDKVQVEFLTRKKSPIDTIVRLAKAEPKNKSVFEKDLLIGSDSNLSFTEVIPPSYYPGRGGFLANNVGELVYGVHGEFLGSLQPVDILSANLIYTGWLRNSAGVAWDLWTRDGVSELEKLHGIWLNMTRAQYDKSWRLLRASIVSDSSSFGLLNSFSEVNDGGRVYIQISSTLNDKANSISCELLEIGDIADVEDVQPPTTAAFTKGFSIGFRA